MSTRDLSYKITVDADSTAQLDQVTEDVETLSSDVEALDGKQIDISTSAETATTRDTVDGINTAVSEVGDGAEEGARQLNDALGSIDADEAAGELDDLASSASAGGVGMGLLGLGVAGVVAALPTVIGLWESYRQRQAEAEAAVRAMVEAWTDVTGLAGEIDDVLAAMSADVDTAGLGAFTQFLRDAENLDFGALQSDLGMFGVGVDDIGEKFIALSGSGEQARSTIAELAVGAGFPPEFADQLAAAIEQGDSFGRVITALQVELAKTGDAGGGRAAALALEYREIIEALNDAQNAAKDFDLDAAVEQFRNGSASATAMAREATAATDALLGPDASSADWLTTWAQEYHRITTEAAAAAEAQERLTAAAGEYAQVTASVDWGDTALQGATTAMSAYTQQLFAGYTQVVAQEAAYDRLGDALRDTDGNLVDISTAFDLTTAAGQRQQQALQGVVASLDGEFARAYRDANGDQEEFLRIASLISDNALAGLAAELGITAEEARGLFAEMMGLTEQDFAARFEMSGVEEARLQLGLLQGVIGNLPDDVQVQVGILISQGAYEEALALIRATLAGADVPIEVRLALEAAEEQISSFTGEERTATITAEADGAEDAAADLDEVADTERTAGIGINIIQAIVANAVLDYAARERTATITAEADTEDADGALDTAAETRTVRINAVIGDTPSANDWARAIPPVRVPIIATLASTPRISGARALGLS